MEGNIMVKIRIEKFKGVTLKKVGCDVEYLWAIIGPCNITLIQIYSSKEPIDFLKFIQDKYDKHK